MWTNITRAKHAWNGLLHSSDLTDAAWVVLEPLRPSRSALSRPPKWSWHAIMEGVFYILRGGQPWRMMPRDLPPASTGQRHLYAWRDSGLWSTINYPLLMTMRVAADRQASSSAGVIDSQSVKSLKAAGLAAAARARKSKAVSAIS